jgi:hypothetical protein
VTAGNGSARGLTLEAAWSRYREGLDALRESLHGMALAQTHADHAAADRWLLQGQAAAYNLVMTPNHQRPSFMVHNVFEPNVYNWLLPNADFLYRYAFVDGASRFRIRGMRRNAHSLDLQVIAGFWGDPAMKLLETYSIEDPDLDSEGRFEIEVGSSDAAGGKRLIRTDPGYRPNTLIVREAFYDWDAELPSDLVIEPVSETGDVCFVLDEREMADRLDASLRMLEFCHQTFCGGLTASVVDAVGYNRFLLVDTSKDEDAANPDAGYVPAAYDLGEEEALIIEFELPRCSYWSLQVGDLWFQAADFMYHQSSLNGFQVEPDVDGRIRVVLSARDPGVPNWLDIAGNARGVVLLRWYRAEGHPVPEATRLPIAEISDLLPRETPRIGPAQRAQRLAARRHAIARRYGA